MEQFSSFSQESFSGNALSSYVSINAAKGLQEIIKSNFGPNGSFKILVSSSGEIKLTKSGNILLKEMQIQNPIASLIARAISTQNFFSGDGTTSIILILGELFRNIEKYIEKRIHPQIICEGIEIGKRELEKWLPSQIIKWENKKKKLIKLAKDILATKIKKSTAFKLAKIVIEAISTIRRKNEMLDLNLIEILEMDHRTQSESRFIKGIVLDHGARHPDMPKILHDTFILICNISLEFEKSEINSTFLYHSTEQQEKLFTKERELIDKKIHRIIQLKRSVCKGGNKGFMVINQKGIDNISLDILCQEGILGIRRAKRKNMERISLLCNAIPINSTEDIEAEVLGFAGLVYEQTIGEEKYTFIENVSNPFAGTILIRGNNNFSKNPIQELIREVLKTIKISSEDKGYLKGAGFIETQAKEYLLEYGEKISGGKKFGILALGKSLLSIPKTLEENQGKNFYKLYNGLKKKNLNLEKKKKLKGNKFQTENSNESLDCFSMKKQIFNSVADLALQLLRIDEILLGKGLGKKLL